MRDRGPENRTSRYKGDWWQVGNPRYQQNKPVAILQQQFSYKTVIDVNKNKLLLPDALLCPRYQSVSEAFSEAVVRSAVCPMPTGLRTGSTSGCITGQLRVGLHRFQGKEGIWKHTVEERGRKGRNEIVHGCLEMLGSPLLSLRHPNRQKFTGLNSSRFLTCVVVHLRVRPSAHR